MPKPVLRFHKDRRFQILMISDFHAGKQCSEKLIKGIEALVQHTSPDLVLVGGDQCLRGTTKEYLADYMKHIMSPVIGRGIPWAAVSGNHDRETDHPIELEFEAYESLPGYVGEIGPDNVSGCGNYCLQVLASRSNEPAYHIWALDSFSEVRDFIRIFNLPANTQFQLPVPMCNGSCQSTVMFDQVLWYYTESQKKETAAGKKIPAIMYMHVPLPEICFLANNPEQCDVRGDKRESIGCSELNSGLFMACLQRGDVKGIFFGHEHLCDFDGIYCGITLGYDAAVGYDMSAHDDLRGGRIITLNEDGSFVTETVKLMDIMGIDAMRDPAYFEGGSKYNFRIL